MSEDVEIEPRTVATLALAVRRPRSHPQIQLDLIYTRQDIIHARIDVIRTRLDRLDQLDLIHTLLDCIHTRQDVIQIRLDVIHTCFHPQSAS